MVARPCVGGWLWTPRLLLAWAALPQHARAPHPIAPCCLLLAEDSTAEEYMDFYLDDETRCKWDSMLSGETVCQLQRCLELGKDACSRGWNQALAACGCSSWLCAWCVLGPGLPCYPRTASSQPLARSPAPPRPPSAETHLLESGDPDSRQQVVRWVRTFPMAIIAQREYVIARRMFREAVRPGWCSSAGWVRSAGWAALELPASAFPALPCGGCTSVCFLSLGPLHPTSCLCRSILVQRRFSQLELI